MTRPNIVFILADQQRWDTVSCYGQPLGNDVCPDTGLTPHLDAMAAQGVRFEHTFTMQPVCGPARSCLQTGMYATETGCHTNARMLPTDVPTIAKAFNDGGYETAYVGKWHLASDGWDQRIINKPIPVDRRGGYRDYWIASDVLEFTSHGYEGYLFDTQGNRVDFEGYRVDCTANFAIDYFRDFATRRSDKPFFLFLSFIEPHHQNDLNRYIGPIGSKQRFADYTVPGDLVGTEGDWRKHMPDYLGCCWSLDQNVGRMREELKTLGLLDDTLMLYTADHGSHFCTRNSEYKRSCHENSIRVPLIAQGPGFEGGRVVDDIVSLIDLPPTVLKAGGIDPLPQMRGRPIQPLADGSATDWPQEAFVQISESQCGRAIRTRRWKYGVDAPDVTRHDPGSDRYVEQYLYDLDADPHERTNLVADPTLADTRAELAATLKRRMVDAGETEPVIDPAP